jgi:hypothetical protein
MKNTRFLESQTIEQLADDLIKRYESNHGAINIPVPIERIAENTLDLILEWRRIPEPGNQIIYAGLNSMGTQVVFNEQRITYFDNTGGFYNTVLAHEIGHKILHIGETASEARRLLPGTDISSEFLFRSEKPGNKLEWQAHRFMGYLLLPYRLLRQFITTEDLCYWPTLYYLREKFDVTISALVIRLTNLGLIYVEDKKIYRSRAVANGQRSLM